MGTSLALCRFLSEDFHYSVFQDNRNDFVYVANYQNTGDVLYGRILKMNPYNGDAWLGIRHDLDKNQCPIACNLELVEVFILYGGGIRMISEVCKNCLCFGENHIFWLHPCTVKDCKICFTNEFLSNLSHPIEPKWVVDYLKDTAPGWLNDLTLELYGVEING